MSATTAGRERLEAGDREQPGAEGGAALIAASLLPHIEEHITQQVFRQGLAADQPKSQR